MKELAPRVVGIDFGNTIFYKENGAKVVYPDAFRVIRRMTSTPNMVVNIISKVDEDQERRAKVWIDEVNFTAETGVPRENIHFCRERIDKALIASKLNLTHHIDDRPEVMSYMSLDIVKFLFRPIPADVVTYFNQLKQHNVRIVNTWSEIEKYMYIMSFDELNRVAGEIASETIRRDDGCLVFECGTCHECHYFACWSAHSLYKKYEAGCIFCKAHNFIVRISDPVTEQGMFE